MQRTDIDYLTHTWNPIVMRCSRISLGCASCWHLRMADRLAGNPKLPIAERDALSGKGPFILRDRELEAPLKLKKPAVIGVQFMGDLFHEDMLGVFIIDTLAVAAQCPQHTFLILTKRPQRMADIWREHFIKEPNFYLGLTICNQAEADEKLPIFLQVPGNKFLSVEPMLENISLWKDFLNMHLIEHFDWIVCGSETGPHARPCDPEWFRSIRDQCQTAGIPFWLKQTDKKRNRLLDGREWNEKPFKEVKS